MDVSALPPCPPVRKNRRVKQDTQRFAALDGLRGVAAAGVLLYHFAGWSGRPGGFAHGYLAVDFFFCLSGFVLAHAFQHGDIGWAAYLRIRIVRIWPLLVLSTVIGAILTSRHSPPFWPNLVRNLLLIPRLDPTPYGTFPSLFPFNPPAWSLCLEVVVSALWFPLRRLIDAGLVTILIACFAVMLWAAAGMHGIETGWDRATFWIGFCRAAYSFTLGWLSWRHRALISRPRLLVAAVVLTAVMVAPILPVRNEVYDLACVTLLFPLVVLMGAHDPGGAVGALCRRAGELSYPVYALHWAIWAVMLRVFPQEELARPLWFCGLALLVTPMVAWIAQRFYDAPVRRWLGRRAARP
ncbi:putative acyltransferase [Caulobacter sp. AP07]|nr:putative acyltransferase [Caulobacter sp. AP07]